MKMQWPVAVVMCLFSASITHAAEFSLRLIGQTEIATGTLFEGEEFGGISGIDRGQDGTYWAISDDRGGERAAPRFYVLSLDYDASGFKSVSIKRRITLKQPNGEGFPASARTVDPESIRVSPHGTLYWSSEGIWNKDAAKRQSPFVREMTTEGAYVRTFSTPSLFDYGDNETVGARDNKVFEALAVMPNGTVLVANEDALASDGSLTTLSAGSRMRVTALDPQSGTATAQYVYELPPIPKAAVPGAPFGPDNGLSEILAYDQSKIIGVERAFAFGVGNTIKLTLAETKGASDVLSSASLKDADITPMTKETLLDLDTLGIKLDNIEGITWGTPLANGHKVLILVSDNNFSSEQKTLFLAFEVVPKS